MKISGGLNSSGSPYSVTASYGSDPEFANSTSAKVKQVVTAGAATVTLASDPNTCNGDICTTSQGSPLTFTATVSATNGTPTGNIVFTIVPAGQKAKQTLQCDGGNTVALSGGQATCTFGNGLPAIVYYTVTATLVDPNYQSAPATPYENTSLLSTDTTVTVGKGTTAGETFPGARLPSPRYRPVAILPRVASTSPSAGPTPTGTTAARGPSRTWGTNGVAVLSVGGGEFPGNYSAYATYVGDQNYLGQHGQEASLRRYPGTDHHRHRVVGEPVGGRRRGDPYGDHYGRQRWWC